MALRFSEFAVVFCLDRPLVLNAENTEMLILISNFAEAVTVLSSIPKGFFVIWMQYRQRPQSYRRQASACINCKKKIVYHISETSADSKKRMSLLDLAA